MLFLENVHMDAVLADNSTGPVRNEAATAPSPASFRSRMARLASTLKERLFRDPPDDEDDAYISPYIVPPII